MLDNAVRAGIAGVALIDRDGNVIAHAGAIESFEAKPFASFVMLHHQADTLSERLFAGEIFTGSTERGDVAVSIAGKQLFVVAVLGGASIDVVSELRERVEARLIRDHAMTPVMGTGSGGSGGSGPDNISLIEFGITVPRAKA